MTRAILIGLAFLFKARDCFFHSRMKCNHKSKNAPRLPAGAGQRGRIVLAAELPGRLLRRISAEPQHGGTVRFQGRFATKLPTRRLQIRPLGIISSPRRLFPALAASLSPRRRCSTIESSPNPAAYAAVEIGLWFWGKASWAQCSSRRACTTRTLHLWQHLPSSSEARGYGLFPHATYVPPHKIHTPVSPSINMVGSRSSSGAF